MTEEQFEYQEGVALLKDMMLNSVSRMIVPSIMECNGGGFIVVIGATMHGCTTLQEAFDFAAAHAEGHFQDSVRVNMRDLPRILRPGLWQRVRSAALGTTTALAFACVISLALWGRTHNDPQQQKRPTTAKYIDLTKGQKSWTGEANRYPLDASAADDEPVDQGGPRSVREVDLPKVWFPPDGREAESGEYPDEARRAGVRSHHQRRRHRHRVHVSNEKPNVGECTKVSPTVLEMIQGTTNEDKCK